MSNEPTVEQLLAAIRQHRDQRGDDRCWLDDRELYTVLPEGVGDADLRLNQPTEMLRNCLRFIETRQQPGVPYVSPQRRTEELEAEVNRLKRKCAKMFGYVRHRGNCGVVRLGASSKEGCTCGLLELHADVNTTLVLDPPKDFKAAATELLRMLQYVRCDDAEIGTALLRAEDAVREALAEKTAAHPGRPDVEPNTL